MNLKKKKLLAQRALKTGKKRIAFSTSRLEEIKEAITKQDIRSLKEDGAIIIKNIKGRKKNPKKIKRSPGNIRKKVKNKKQEYVKITRKLRKYVVEMKKQAIITPEEGTDIRKKIRNRFFKSQAHLKEYIKNLRK